MKFFTFVNDSGKNVTVVTSQFFGNDFLHIELCRLISHFMMKCDYYSYNHIIKKKNFTLEFFIF